MANLFSYATSELSQDAFLCWLFSNLRESDLETYNSTKIIARFLLFKFLDIKDTNQKIEIKSIDKQWRHIDVAIDVLIDDTVYVLAIEDKTKSSIHSSKDYTSQLVKYYEILNEYWEKRKKKKKKEYYFKDYQLKCIVYKTDFLSEIDKQNENENWTFYDINQLVAVYKEAKSQVDKIESDILNHYIDRLIKFDKCINNEIPVYEWKKSKDPIYEVAWEHLFNKIEKKISDGCNCVVHVYNGIYMYLTIYDKEYDNRLPHLEIKPRDVKNEKNCFNIRILVKAYGVENKSKELLKYWSNNLKVKCKNLKDIDKCNTFCNVNVKIDNELSIEEIVPLLSEEIKNIFELMKKYYECGYFN